MDFNYKLTNKQFLLNILISFKIWHTSNYEIQLNKYAFALIMDFNYKLTNKQIILKILISLKTWHALKCVGLFFSLHK